MQPFQLERVPTPIGEMLLLTDAAGRLRALDFHDYQPRMERLLRLHYGADAVAWEDAPGATPARRAVENYLGGELSAIDRLAVETGGTTFQRAVWAALRGIPAGQTVSYGELSRRLGRPRSVRAVGLANGANPVALVVPCHRVIGADRSLTGYGGGIDRKRWLLEHEASTDRVPRRRPIETDSNATEQVPPIKTELVTNGQTGTRTTERWAGARDALATP